MSWLEALILGIVQGLTEFLPVSSSGHLEIGHALLGTSGEDNLSFAVLVHTATVLSTLVVLWREVAQLFVGTFTTPKWNQEKNYVAKILVSMIPVFVVGIFFKDEVEALFGNGLLLVGICLLITAALLTLSEWLQKKRQSKGHEVGYKDAFIIGIAQACAVKKESVAQFSFLMVLIPILGEALLDGIKIIQGEVTSELDLLPAVVGFVAAFVTGCLACRFMIEIVRRQRLVWFAIYCAIIGTTAILATVC